VDVVSASLLSNLPEPGQLAANLIDAILPTGGLAIFVYRIYSFGQSWIDAFRNGTKLVNGASGIFSTFLSRSGGQRVWFVLRPFMLAAVAVLWVACTYVQANFIWSYFVRNSALNEQVNGNGTITQIGQQDFSTSSLWGLGSQASRVLVEFALLILLLAFVTRSKGFSGTLAFIVSMPAQILGLAMIGDSFLSFLNALNYHDSWTPFFLCMIVLGAVIVYIWSSFVGLFAACKLGELVRPKRR
jgi:hypothetical protein